MHQLNTSSKNQRHSQQWGTIDTTHHANPSSFPLSFANEGETVRICRVHGNSVLKERLHSMGIRTDDEIIVLQRQLGGAVVIEKAGARFVLGGGMAHKIHVIRSNSWNRR